VFLIKVWFICGPMFSLLCLTLPYITFVVDRFSGRGRPPPYWLDAS